MLQLRNLIKRLDYEGGWTGIVPAGEGHLGGSDLPADSIRDRCTKAVLKGLADRLNSERAGRGVTCSKVDLGEQAYSERAVGNALSILERANIIRRIRNRDEKTGMEKHATTLVNPALIDLAKVVAKHQAQLKKGKKMEPTIPPSINLPISGWGSGNPHEQVLADVPHANVAPRGMQPLHTSYGIHAPRPSALGRDGLSEKGQESGGDFEVSDFSKKIPTEFLKTSAARADLAAGRLERRRERGQLVGVPNRSNGDLRPFLWEYEVLPKGEKISDLNRLDGNLYDCDHTVHFEARAFGNTLDSFNAGAQDHSALCLTRPKGKGQLPIFVKEISQNGLGSFDFQKAFSLSFFKSHGCTEEAENGEQLFVKPSANSRLVLVDDLPTPAPIFGGALCIILETSSQNYQHLYCFDRVLTGAERQHIQTRMAREFGGDARACGPFQPHRCPGSVNYKKGRGQFVTRLVGTVSNINGGKPLKASKWLSDFDTTADTKSVLVTATEWSDIEHTELQPRSNKTDGKQNESEQEWHLSIMRVSGLKSRGFNADEIAANLVKWLSSKAAPRRGSDANRYARKTVENLQKAGHI
jgi:RepB DNA-primase from phage plasmid